MKISKIHSIGLSLLFALGLGVSSCQDDFSGKTPVIEEPVAENHANMNILEFKQAYWPKTEDGNYDTSVTDFAVEIGNHPTLTDEHIYVSGRVISSDQAGNIYKSLVLQDATGALAFSINQYDLYLKYPIGQEVVVDLTGLYAGMYRGLFQIGMPSESNGTTSCSFLPDELFKIHAEKNGLPEPDKTKVIVLDNTTALGSSPEDLMKNQSQFVRFNDVKFELAGQAQFASYKNTEDRTLLDSYGNTLVVRTSGYSNFWQHTLPADNFDIEGIMAYYTTGSKATWQMMLNDYAGIMNVGNPSATPGTSKNPFTTMDWVEKLNAGEAISGWVSGYIVGAVALGVTEITSDLDIEWTATPLAPNTLVIGATPTTKTLAEALIIELPQGSDLRNVGNLPAHPELYGKQISVVGIGGKVLGANGVCNNTGTSEEFVIEGVQVGPVEGDGTEAKPYSCAQVIAKNPSSTTEAVETGVWVSGYIVGSIPTGGASTSISGTVFGLENAASSNLVIGPSSSCTDYNKCVVVQLVSGSAARTALNLASNPNNLGKLVSVKGDIMKYCGGPGVKNTYEYKLDGTGSDTPTPGPVGDPKGTGTQADPYNVAMAQQVTKALAADTPTEKVYVSGIVSSVKEISTQFGNGTFSISDDGTTTGEFLIYRAYYLNGEKFTSTDQVKVGDKVVVYGQLVNFKGNTPEMTQGGQIVSIENGSNPNPNPDPNPGGNSLENPYTVAKAQEIIAAGSYTSDKVYIKGVISQIDEVNTQYGNAGYYISDNGTTTGQLQIFRGYYLNGEKFTSADQIKVGDKVVILGVLTSYNGKPQVNTGSQIVTLNGNGGGQDPTPDPDPTPVTGTSADFNTFNNSTANTMSYGTYKTAQGWVADWALILAGGTDATNFVSSDAKFLFPCLNGTPARPGKLTSPTISGGIKKLTFKYGFPYNETKVKFTVNILQGGKVVATETVAVDSPVKAQVYTFTKDLSVSGDFVIEIINEKYSAATVNNKDRLAIWDLTWEK